MLWIDRFDYRWRGWDSKFDKGRVPLADHRLHFIDDFYQFRCLARAHVQRIECTATLLVYGAEKRQRFSATVPLWIENSCCLLRQTPHDDVLQRIGRILHC